CGVSPLAWAVGAYLPIGTTFPIFVGGCLRWVAEKLSGQKSESEVSPEILFATGLVAGGTLTGVASSVLKAVETKNGSSDLLTDAQGIGERFQHALGMNLDLLALIPYTILAVM